MIRLPKKIKIIKLKRVKKCAFFVFICPLGVYFCIHSTLIGIPYWSSICGKKSGCDFNGYNYNWRLSTLADICLLDSHTTSRCPYFNNHVLLLVLYRSTCGFLCVYSLIISILCHILFAFVPLITIVSVFLWFYCPVDYS